MAYAQDMPASHRNFQVCSASHDLVVEPVHPGSNPRLGMDVCIHLDLFQDLTDAMLSVVGDVPVNSEAPVVTSSTSEYAGSVPQRCS
jgi:hypothetical protein